MIGKCTLAILLISLLHPTPVTAQGYQDLRDYCQRPDLATKCTDAKAHAACQKLETKDIPLADELAALKACVGPAGKALAATSTTAARGSALAATVASGVQQFLVDRAKAELSVFATEHLKSKLCGKPRPFFENTCAVFDVSSITATADLSTLAAAFRRDLLAAPSRIAKLLASDPKLACALEVGALAIDVMKNGSELLRSVSTFKPTSCTTAGVDLTSVKDVVDKIIASAGALELIQQGKYLLLLTLLYDQASAYDKLKQYRPLLDTIRHLIVSTSDPVIAASAGGQKQIVAAVINLVRQITELSTSDATTIAHVELALDLGERIMDADYGGAMVLLLSNKQLLAPMNAMSEDAARYLGLAAGIATATSSAEVAKVLEQAAAPLGGWRRKHASSIGLSLSGFVGATLHRERLRSPTNVAAEPPGAWGAAPYIALGLDLHKSIGSAARIGLFTSLVDIGAVTSTRFSEDDPVPMLSVEETPEIGFAQLFAPGAYLYVSLGRSPVVLGAGFSYVPNLRRVDVTQADGTTIISDEVAAARMGVFLAVDVTLFPLVGR